MKNVVSAAQPSLATVEADSPHRAKGDRFDTTSNEDDRERMHGPGQSIAMANYLARRDRQTAFLAGAAEPKAPTGPALMETEPGAT